MILLPLCGLALGVLLLKRPDFVSENENWGFRPLFITKRLVQFFGFMFTVFSVIFLVVGVVAIISKLGS